MGDKKETARPRGTDSVQLIQAIQVMVSIGEGTAKDPKRVIVEFWDLQGNLLAVNDPCAIYPGAPASQSQ